MKAIPKNRMALAGVVLLLFFASGCSTTPPPTSEPYSKRPLSKTEKKQYNAKRYLMPYKVLGKWYRPLADAHGFRQTGVASWYGVPFHGRPTSSGFVYDMHGISAAHKILPLGTIVRVRNLENGRTLKLQINDRGPFVAGRIIDLSKGAAQKLGVYGPGTARVEVVALGKAPLSGEKYIPPKKMAPVDYQNGNFVIQVGVFGDHKNAVKLVKTLSKTHKNAYIKASRHPQDKRRFYRVLIGEYRNLQKAETYERALKAQGYNDAFTIAE